MSELLKRGIDIQLFAEGNEDATQEQNENENMNQEVESPTPSEGEAIKDDENPIEALKMTAIELGLNPEELAIMTTKELQSYVDSQITKAIKTREEKLKKKAEIEKMKEKGEYEKLLKQERKEALEDLKITYLKAKGLPEEIGALIDVNNLIDLSLTDAKEQLTDVVDKVAEKINELVEQKVSEKIKNMEAGTFKSTSEIQKQLADNPKEALRQIFHGEVKPK